MMTGQLSGCYSLFVNAMRLTERFLVSILSLFYKRPDPELDSKAARLLRFENETDSEFNLMMFLVLIGLVLLYAMRQSIFSANGLHQTMVRARTLAPRGAAGAHKRSV